MCFMRHIVNSLSVTAARHLLPPIHSIHSSFVVWSTSPLQFSCSFATHPFPLLCLSLSRWFLGLCRFRQQKKSAARTHGCRTPHSITALHPDQKADKNERGRGSKGNVRLDLLGIVPKLTVQLASSMTAKLKDFSSE
jgi:hypothetical protein